MAANVETMFYVREVPWHGLGTQVDEALDSKDALRISGLDWKVTQESIYMSSGEVITNYKVNVRETDKQVLGVVSDRYQIVQNEEAFAFTDALLGEGVKFETAGSLQTGKKIWLLAILPDKYKILGEDINPYLVFSNAHDGMGSIKICMTPIRVVCQNTLNIALSNANRTWSTKHIGNIQNKLYEAQRTLQQADNYMKKLNDEFEELYMIKLTDEKVNKFINDLIEMPKGASDLQMKNVNYLRNDLRTRYFEAPDLKVIDNNGYRLISAVSDFATHVKPLRTTKTYGENLFIKTIEGNPVIDKAYEMLKAA